MDPTAVPTRITIDFRDAIHPSRTWILGVGAADARVELLAFDGRIGPTLAGPSDRPRPHGRPTALAADCACPDFCERDHSNE